MPVPWKAVLAYISGANFGIPSLIDKPIVLRQFLRTFSSLAYILPDSRFWKSDEVTFFYINFNLI